ncbi:MAG: hypothetical protein A2Z16_01110 [Chloroflexi bacterium RBG_16_54_18]|nr:MAG: hypothetical protein A2Z16_01110 [Chloroflexi bacterium RBG_16_54_18]
MKTKAFAFSLIIILVLSGGYNWLTFAAQPEETERYFPATGHWVKGEFLKTYNQVHEPIKLYGYPLTEAFSSDLSSNTLVQFFNKAMFILRVNSSTGVAVEVMPIGRYLYTADNPRALIENFSGCRVYPEADFPICYAFLEFYEIYGGVAQFGKPISGIELQNGYKVQNFERARLEFHPELPLGKKVVVADLGSEYFYLMKLDPLLLRPIANAAINGILSLKVRAFPQNSVTGTSGRQLIYVIVQDQKKLSVPGAQVLVKVKLPDGQLLSYAVAKPSNEFGMVDFDFIFNSSRIGSAVVEIKVIYEGIEAQTVTSFRIWQ